MHNLTNDVKILLQSDCNCWFYDECFRSSIKPSKWLSTSLSSDIFTSDRIQTALFEKRKDFYMICFHCILMRYWYTKLFVNKNTALIISTGRNIGNYRLIVIQYLHLLRRLAKLFTLLSKHLKISFWSRHLVEKNNEVLCLTEIILVYINIHTQRNGKKLICIYFLTVWLQGRLEKNVYLFFFFEGQFQDGTNEIISSFS